MDFLNSLLPTIEHFHFLGYWIVLLILLIDSIAFVGLISPGTLLVIGIGFLSSQGFLDIGDVIWFAAFGAILGDMISYYIGKHTGGALFKDGNKIFKVKYIESGQEFFNKHGNKAIFLDRFIGPVRPIATFIAGTSNMNRRKFFFWSVVSSVSWVTTFVLLGYLFSQAWETIALWSTRGSIFLVSFFVVIALLYILKWLLIKKGKQFFAFWRSIWQSAITAILENDDFKTLVKKHHVLFGFLKARFNTSRFLGLPTTLLFSSFIYTLILFAGIVEDIITSDVITSVDTRIMNLLALFRNSDVTQFFLWVTLLGKWQIVLGFAIAVVSVLWIWRKRVYILPLLLTIGGAEIFTAISKIVFHRPRPELAVYTEHSFSFPSGHATIAVAFYGFLIYLLIRHVTAWKTKINIFFAGLVVIILIGFSRLYLGVHYVSDVWGGYLVGAIWLIIGISISEWTYSRKKTRAVSSLQSNAQTVSVALLVLSLCWYVIFGLNYHPLLKQQPVQSQEVEIQNVQDIFTDEQLKYTETLTEARQEPLSFVVLAKSDNNVITDFEKSGWYLADSVNILSLAKTAEAAIFKKEYLRAPMTPSFWNKETHTFGFEKPTDTNNVRERHHARFWRTSYVTQNGMRVYVGTASLDKGVKWGVTHQIAPDIDTEREVLFSDLQRAGAVRTYTKEQFVKPTLGENFSGDQFFTDGNVYIVFFE